MTTYTVLKTTGTHADALAAIGAADLLRHLEPSIVEMEDRFEVRLARKVKNSDLDAVDPGFCFLDRRGTGSPEVSAERIAPERMAPESRMYGILGRMKAYAGPNRVITQFAKMRQGEWARRVRASLAGDASGFVGRSPLVQLFNPQAAKGYSLLKPRGTNRRDKTKDQWGEPFLEWLRYRGYFEGAAGWYTGGDLRLYCPIPGNIEYDRFATAAAAFRHAAVGGSAVKMDCRAVLRLTRLLLESGDMRTPRGMVPGIWVTHYKDMGQAHTLMRMDQLAIPEGFDSTMVEEHDTAIRRLADDHSDEFALLKQYRRMFQISRSSAAAEFVEFLRGYGLLLFRRRAQDHWTLPQLRVNAVTRLTGFEPNLGAAMRNQGFLAVAGAIRSSTLGAQAARRNGKADRREVRYGLLADLSRAGRLGKKELIAAVTAFIAEFNREGTRRRMSGLRSLHIQQEEVAAFVNLIETSAGTAMTGALLCGIAACLPGDVVTASPGYEQPAEAIFA